MKIGGIMYKLMKNNTYLNPEYTEYCDVLNQYKITNQSMGTEIVLRVFDFNLYTGETKLV